MVEHVDNRRGSCGRLQQQRPCPRAIRRDAEAVGGEPGQMRQGGEIGWRAMDAAAIIDKLRVDGFLIEIGRFLIIDGRRAAFLKEHAEHGARPLQISDVPVDHEIDARRLRGQLRESGCPAVVDLVEQRESVPGALAKQRRMIGDHLRHSDEQHRGARILAVRLGREWRADRVVAQRPAGRIGMVGVVRR